MGLRMDDIHAPSISGTSTGAVQDGRSTKSLFDMMDERQNLEAELTALGGVLTSHNVDMNTPLLTPDGFPRSDIDVAQIRTTRARIIWLRNDYKSLMARIEAGLHAHHASLQANPPPTTDNNAAARSDNTGSTASPQPHAFSNSSLEPPFAKVNSIVDGSPANTAGMQAGDEIRRFGAASWTNHERLTHVAQIVGRSEGQEILVKVKRRGSGGVSQELDLRLTPRRNWGGRGMLGCHLVPV